MRALTPWQPLGELGDFHRDIDEWFTRFFGEEPRLWPAAAWTTSPAIDMFVRDGELVIHADLPGIDPKAVELSIEGRRLVIRGERRLAEERAAEDYLHREVVYGRFERSVTLPEDADAESVKATCKDGVLEVTMKAPTDMATRKVPITTH
jgi:HSP20 family protein